MPDKHLSRQVIYTERTSLSQFETDAPVMKELIRQLQNCRCARTWDNRKFVGMLNDAYYLCTLAIEYGCNAETIIDTDLSQSVSNVQMVNRQYHYKVVYCITWCLLRLHQESHPFDAQLLHSLRKELTDFRHLSDFEAVVKKHLTRCENVSIPFSGKHLEDVRPVSPADAIRKAKTVFNENLEDFLRDYDDKCHENEQLKTENGSLRAKVAELEAALRNMQTPKPPLAPVPQPPMNNMQAMQMFQSMINGKQGGVSFLFCPTIIGSNDTNNDNQNCQVFNGSIDNSNFTPDGGQQ